ARTTARRPANASPDRHAAGRCSGSRCGWRATRSSRSGRGRSLTTDRPIVHLPGIRARSGNQSAVRRRDRAPGRAPALQAWSSVPRGRCIVARAGLLLAALTVTRADARPRPIFEITPTVSDAGFGTALAVAGDALVVGGGGRSGGSGRVSVFDLGTGQPRL